MVNTEIAPVEDFVVEFMRMSGAKLSRVIRIDAIVGLVMQMYALNTDPHAFRPARSANQVSPNICLVASHVWVT